MKREPVPGYDLPVTELEGPAAVDEAAVRRRYEELTLLLLAQGRSITAMESCTSGQIASLLTDTEGASAVFKGSFVAYSNEAKVRMGVNPRVIEEYGVYSPQTAAAMAQACRAAFGAELGVGVTGSFGNADPSNADSRPGEVFFALDAAEGTECFHCTVPAQPSRLAYKLWIADIIADCVRAACRRSHSACGLVAEGGQ
jgi:nicotinamide-nucleotide amidase